MFSKLTDKEINATEKLLRFGMLKSVTALKSILATNVSLKSLDFDLKGDNVISNYCLKTEEKVHLLKTELVGDMKGSCHLLLSEDEVIKIQNACLPEDVLVNNNPETRLMKLEFLTEIDNMAGGAVITQLSNYLDLEIYGNVPSLHIMQADEVNKYLQAEAIVYDFSIEFRAVFEMTDLQIESEFIWLLQDTFIDQIKLHVDHVLSAELI